MNKQSAYWLVRGIWLLFFTVCLRANSPAQSVPVDSANAATLTKSRLLRFEADSSRGFNFPYLVFLPAGMSLGDSLPLLVEPNNSGFVNDTLAVHERAARRLASVSSVGNHVAKTLGIPLLVPIFPRSATDWIIYTHALDRDVALLKQGSLARLDRQLLAMIDDARKQLTQHAIRLRERVLLNGFSASGTFVNRLALIHPERVAGVACGGINALAILPVTTWQQTPLPYPLGLHDFAALFGKAPNLTRYRQIPQLLYMGALDDNDAVRYDDAYSEAERAAIHSVLGQVMLPNRWRTCEAIYQANGIQATFRTYPGIGHRTDEKLNGEVAVFFKNVIRDQAK